MPATQVHFDIVFSLCARNWFVFVEIFPVADRLITHCASEHTKCEYIHRIETIKKLPERRYLILGEFYHN